MNQDPEYHDRLERLIDQELKRLPQLPVPESLLQRVKSAIEEEQRKPWWQKPWSCWPMVIQLFFLASLLGLAGSLVYALSLAPTDASAQWIAAKFDGAHALLSTSTSIVLMLANAFLLLLNTVFSSWLLVAIAAASILYTSSVVLGVAWFRIALSRRMFNFRML